MIKFIYRNDGTYITQITHDNNPLFIYELEYHKHYTLDDMRRLGVSLVDILELVDMTNGATASGSFQLHKFYYDEEKEQEQELLDKHLNLDPFIKESMEAAMAIVLDTVEKGLEFKIIEQLIKELR